MRALCLIIIGMLLVSGQLFGDIHYFPKKEVNIEVPNNWTIKDGWSTIVAIEPEGLVTLNVKVRDHHEIITANGVQSIRMNNTYDGWVNKLQRDGKPSEKLYSNVNDMNLAVYSLHTLDDNMTINEQLAIEYCYVVDTKSYI
jgi:hypothetical protein